MANTASAKKAVKQSEARRVFNLRRLRELKKAVKDVRTLIEKKEGAAATAALPGVFKAIDKATKHGTIKRGNADRKKSRITAAIAKIK